MNGGQRIAIALATVFIGWGAAVPAALAQSSVEDAIKYIDSLSTGAQGAGGASAAPVSFVPPPRTIKDITAILDQQKPDPAKAAALRATADAKPPENADKAMLASFYRGRAEAARQIGRLTQRRDDLREAVRLLREIQASSVADVLNDAVIAEVDAGNSKAALALLFERLNGTQTGSPKQSQVMSNIARTYALVGNIEEAEKWASRAEKRDFAPQIRARIHPAFFDFFAADSQRVRGNIFDASGNYREAEAAYRSYIATTEARVVPNAQVLAAQSGGQASNFIGGLTTVRLLLAKDLMQQSRLAEAESEARRSLLDTLSARGRYAPESGRAVLTLAAIVYSQGRYTEAEQLARAALDTFAQIGTDPATVVVSEARRMIARALGSQDKWTDAAQIYAQMKTDIGNDPALAQQFLTGNIDYAVTLLRTGHATDAAPVVEQAAAIAEKTLGPRHYNTAAARAWLGVVLAQNGQTDRAASEFAAAVPILLEASRETDSDDDGSATDQRERQLQLLIESYMGLLADTKGSAAAAETFHLADAIRGQSVQRALAASSARATVSDPALANLARHEQDAQMQGAALQALLADVLSHPAAEQEPGALQALRQRIDRIRTARARIREEIERRFPSYVNLIDPRPATVEQAQKSLKPGEALIATYVGESRLFVWAVPQQGPAAFAAAKVRDSEVEGLVTALRKSLDPQADTIDDIPAFDVAKAYRLYELLLKPVQNGWASAKSLMIVPHKSLGLLPTALLVTDNMPQPAKAAVPFQEYKSVPFLARKVAVTQLPSVASLATLRALPPPKPDRKMFAAFGDPWFSPQQAAEGSQQVAQAGLQTRGIKTRGVPLVRRSAPKTEGIDSADLAALPRLPDTADEVKSIALALRADIATDVFLGDKANEAAVKSMNLSGRKIVMFATHGLVPGDLNGLTQPALALSSPSVAKVDGDGLLTMEEILALKLDADWVVLSACNTATGSGSGAEAVSGLGRAFFYAGTRALLVSNWPVETVSARTLTTDLFRRQADNPGLARAEAMREAELALIDSPGAVDPASNKPLFSYAHPIFWAPFTVVGDGG
jgi:CHAT domain-containing protein